MRQQSGSAIERLSAAYGTEGQRFESSRARFSLPIGCLWRGSQQFTAAFRAEHTWWSLWRPSVVMRSVSRPLAIGVTLSSASTQADRHAVSLVELHLGWDSPDHARGWNDEDLVEQGDRFVTRQKEYRSTTGGGVLGPPDLAVFHQRSSPAARSSASSRWNVCAVVASVSLERSPHSSGVICGTRR